MSDILSKMPKKLSDHLIKLAEQCGLYKNKKDFDRFINSWLTKKAIFDKTVEKNGLKIVDSVKKSFSSGIIILTYSGSFLTLAPLNNQVREITYTNLGFRNAIPSDIYDENGNLLRDVKNNEIINLKCGPIKATSPVVSIALYAENKFSNDEIKNFLNQLGKKIGNFFYTQNKKLFKKSDEKGKHKIDDYFDKWIILEWFRIGGWEEYVYIIRSKFLFHELFDAFFEKILKKINSKAKIDNIFTTLINTRFPSFIDVYKWLESEKKDFDIGLMKALEEIPEREDFKVFLDKYFKNIDT